MSGSAKPIPEAARAAVAYLRDPATIRARAERVLRAGLGGQLSHFRVDLDRMDEVAAFVVEVTRAAYPDLAIPYHSRWGHFRVGDVDRVAEFDALLAALPAEEQGVARYDLAITSVLLDAGAGPSWRFAERESGASFARSEGLAVASFRAFVAGAFSSDAKAPLRADAHGLARMSAERLGRAFQVESGNPLVGLEGRTALLTRLAEATRAAPHLFPAAEDLPPRPGDLFRHLLAQAREGGGALPARAILAAVLEGLAPIWDSPNRIAGVPLGDVWAHPQAQPRSPEDIAAEPALATDMVPFHKLSQWLSYSLVEPLEAAGVRVEALDELTGLPEYRNGGLFVDLGVLALRSEAAHELEHPPSSELIVEWRALTVALLDRLGEAVRARLGMDRDALPLVKVLEGGTWRAGRIAAAERRESGAPPIRIDSDGTVF
ncbi:URC4/urg3 family protein [Haliangium ochraceum]|uniref:Uracil phosphoribosyltransferase n=1 Tax=Haliangium ochraceum (strain DSM 14365 / JCM 11303 / SMP-2) TaxID=502025 RepID=D0LKZ7_HALO1|nr:URC4/urg3 family protein [Haliangium ochraceum]ACY16717.1 protein of unknown function DUF1688 [Haliangium ochraceum DSM 14365]